MSKHLFPTVNEYLPSGGEIAAKASISYQATRLMASAFNATQMALAEAYINGVEIPDPVLRSVFHASMPILFKSAPGLVAPYEWVLEESAQLAESSPELMKVQYD